VALLKQNLLMVALVVAQMVHGDDSATDVSSYHGQGTLLKQNLLVVALVVAQMVHGDGATASPVPHDPLPTWKRG
jgi:hypothetical protein